jgi:hypothetical protein
MGAQICVERELGGTVVVIPVAIEVRMSSWRNDRGHVGSGRGSCAPVDCAWSCLSHRQEQVPRLGAPVAHRLARGFHVSLGRGGKMLPEAPISPETFPQGSGGMEFVVRVASD